MSNHYSPRPEATGLNAAGVGLLFRSEDWWAVWIGGGILAIALAAVLTTAGGGRPTRTMSRKHPSRGQRRLAAILVAVVSIWGYALPRLERTRLVQTRIKHLHHHGIEPAAFFYTD